MGQKEFIMPATQKHARSVITDSSGKWSKKKAIEAYGNEITAFIWLSRLFDKQLKTPDGKYNNLKATVNSLSKGMSQGLRDELFTIMTNKIKVKPDKNKKELISELLKVKTKFLVLDDLEFTRLMYNIIDFGLPISTIEQYFRDARSE